MPPAGGSSSAGFGSQRYARARSAILAHVRERRSQLVALKIDSYQQLVAHERKMWQLLNEKGPQAVFAHIASDKNNLSAGLPPRSGTARAPAVTFAASAGLGSSAADTTCDGSVSIATVSSESAGMPASDPVSSPLNSLWSDGGFTPRGPRAGLGGKRKRLGADGSNALDGSLSVLMMAKRFAAGQVARGVRSEFQRGKLMYQLGAPRRGTLDTSWHRAVPRQSLSPRRRSRYSRPATPDDDEGGDSRRVSFKHQTNEEVLKWRPPPPPEWRPAQPAGERFTPQQVIHIVQSCGAAAAQRLHAAHIITRLQPPPAERPPQRTKSAEPVPQARLDTSHTRIECTVARTSPSPVRTLQPDDSQTRPAVCCPAWKRPKRARDCAVRPQYPGGSTSMDTLHVSGEHSGLESVGRTRGAVHGGSIVTSPGYDSRVSASVPKAARPARPASAPPTRPSRPAHGTDPDASGVVPAAFSPGIRPPNPFPMTPGTKRWLRKIDLGIVVDPPAQYRPPSPEELTPRGVETGSVGSVETAQGVGDVMKGGGFRDLLSPKGQKRTRKLDLSSDEAPTQAAARRARGLWKLAQGSTLSATRAVNRFRRMRKDKMPAVLLGADSGCGRAAASVALSPLSPVLKPAPQLLASPLLQSVESGSGSL
eukprot:TRINITY_DN9764_c1_g1_i1.p1 TRINITY_DN9764_c1_g1~~TRINITY_DN9764_c1_g1_i1.p1  ORF type:complete len:650 (+),score=127.02 TRINITY_DN9764_c1_g1_i1:75-2024(+)